jgi:hypothetical protein
MHNTACEDDERPPASDPGRIANYADTSICFRCPDVDEVYAHLHAKGVEVEKPVVQYYGAFMVCFQWAPKNVTDALPKA